MKEIQRSVFFEEFVVVIQLEITCKSIEKREL